MTYSESYTIEKHAQLVFISAFLSPYDELFNIKQNFKMKKYMPLEGLRWSRDSGSALYDTPQTAVLGRAGGGSVFFSVEKFGRLKYSLYFCSRNSKT